MGKTIRKYPYSMFRHPRGAKQAKAAMESGEAVRHGAVPPDAWDDEGFSHEVWLPLGIAARMRDEGRDRDEVLRMLVRRFGYTWREAEKCAPLRWWTRR